MAVWGMDFKFHNASWEFGNMTQVRLHSNSYLFSFILTKQLVNYINANPSLGVKIRYSTLAEYFDYLNSFNWTWPVVNYLDFELGWPHKVGGFSPNTSYQTGALTSRPQFKGFKHLSHVLMTDLMAGLIRSSGSILRAAEILFSLITGIYSDDLSPEDFNYLNDNLVLARRLLLFAI